MAINYTKIGWDTSKYVNPTNMNQMDNGIKAACDGVDAISANYMKASTTDGQTMVITSAQNTGFFLQSGTGRSNIGFKNSSGAVIGFLGVGSDSKPYFYDNMYREIALAENVVKLSSATPQQITITGAFSSGLSLKSGQNTRSILGFVDVNDTVLGYLGANSSKKPVFFDTAEHEIALAENVIPYGGEQAFTVSSSSSKTVAVSSLTHSVYLITSIYQTGSGIYAGIFIKNVNTIGLTNIASSGVISVSADTSNISFSVPTGYGSSAVRIIALA